MAKELFDKTKGDLDAGNIRATGVGLREGEIAALDTIGQELGDYLDAEPIARNAISRLAIRRFIEAYQMGELTPEVLSGYFERPDRPQPKLRL